MASFLKLMFSTPEETQTSQVKDDITASAEEASGGSEFTGNISLSMQPPANPDDTPMLGVEPNSLPSSLSQDQRNAALQLSSYCRRTLLSKILPQLTSLDQEPTEDSHFGAQIPEDKNVAMEYDLDEGSSDVSEGSDLKARRRYAFCRKIQILPLTFNNISARRCFGG